MGNGTILSVALLVGTVVVIVYMLGAEAPATRLPERTLLFNVVWSRLVAFEAIGELWLASSTPLA